MTKTTSDVLDELKLFRSRLFEIDTDDDGAKAKLDNILNEYQNADKYNANQFEAFAEEYLITRFGLDNVWKICFFFNEISRQKCIGNVPICKYSLFFSREFFFNSPFFLFIVSLSFSLLLPLLHVVKP